MFALGRLCRARLRQGLFRRRCGGSLASGLPVFTTRKGWKDWSVGALGTVALTGDLLHGFKLVGGGTYTRLLNDFGRSPLSIAGNRSQWIGVVGLAYTF